VAVVGFCGALMFVVLGIAFRLHSRSVEDFIVCPEDGPREPPPALSENH
jgi:hypothetical protein